MPKRSLDAVTKRFWSSTVVERWFGSLANRVPESKIVSPRLASRTVDQVGATTTSQRRIPTWALPIALALAAFSAIYAGSIEVVVQETGGRGIAGVKVTAIGIDMASANPFAAERAEAITDSEGHAVFSGFRPGTYGVVPGPLSDPLLVSAEEPTPGGIQAVTLLGESDTARVSLNFVRGVRVVIRVTLDGGPWPNSMGVAFRGTPGSGRAWVPVPESGPAELTLRPGHYEAILKKPATVVVTGATVGRTAVDAEAVPLDLSRPGEAVTVTWALSAPCRIHGTVRSDKKPRPGVHVEAKLIEGGPWVQMLQRRNVYPYVTGLGDLDEQGEYSIQLPPGRWTVLPVGDDLIESVPASLEVAVADGEEGRADFVVREKGADPARALRVRVVDPGGNPIVGANVGVWTEPGPTGEARFVSADFTGRESAEVVFREIAAGTYRVAGGREGFVGTELATTFDPDAAGTGTVTLVLHHGATLQAFASDREGKPAPGVSLELEREEAKRELGRLRYILDGGVSGRKDVANASGHLLIAGLAPGRYRARAFLPEAEVGDRLVTIGRGGEDRGSATEIAIDGEERVDLALHVVQAGKLIATLACTDGGPLPHDVTVRVLGLPGEGDHEDDNAPWAGTVIPLATVALKGPKGDQIEIAPLDRGEYRLAVKPDGYGLWTWAPGTERRADAGLMNVERGETASAGRVSIRCGAGVRIVLRAKSEEPVPDLGPSRVKATLKRQAEPARKQESRKVVAETSADRILLRELPEGDAELDLTIDHPYFLPSAKIHGSFPVELVRGGITPVFLTVDAIGGAVRVRGTGLTARLLAANGTARVARIADGAALFEGVAPGIYRAELCGNVGCSEILRAWDRVIVNIATTAELADRNP